MGKFIRLHNSENNTVVLINTNIITIVDTDEYNDDGKARIVSRIYTDNSTNIDDFQVNESPEKIFEMMKE